MNQVDTDGIAVKWTTEHEQRVGFLHVFCRHCGVCSPRPPQDQIEKFAKDIADSSARQHLPRGGTAYMTAGQHWWPVAWARITSRGSPEIWLCEHCANSIVYERCPV